MYLKELLDKAFLTENPISGEHVTLCPSGICQWCDISLVVTVSDWEAVYVQYRASEPDIELTFSVLMSNPAKSFLQEFANSDIVRARYQQLRVDWGATSQEEVDAKSEIGETYNIGEGESIMPSEFRQSDFGRPAMEEEYEVPPVKDEILTSPSGLEGSGSVSAAEDTTEQNTSLSGGDVFSSPFMAGAEELSTRNFSDASEEEILSDVDGSLGIGDDAPVITLTPSEVTLNPKMESEGVIEAVREVGAGELQNPPALDNQEELVASVEELPADVGIGLVPEAPAIQQELVIYIKEVKETQMISLNVNDWARDCADTFARLYADFVSLFKTLSLSLLFEGNSTSVEEFVQKWAEMNWRDSDYDAEFYPLESSTQFLRLLLVSYQDALKFCCYDSQEKAVDLAKLFADLIYEE